MNDHIIKKGSVYTRAWEIISKDDSIPPEEKKAILRLIQVLVETRERSREPQPQPQNQSEESQGITQEVISQHSLIATIKHQADELDALKRISLNLTSSLDLQKVLDAVVTEAMGLVRNAMGVHIFLYERGELEFGSSLDMNGVRNKPISIPRRDGLTYSVVKTGRQIIIDDMPNHPIYQTMQIYNSGSIIGIPLKFKDEIVGVMNLSRSVKGRFSRSELRLMSLLADQAAVAIFNASLYKRVTQMANTDSVTGLPNRRALDERLQEELYYASRTNTQFSVVMMDLDGFKSVNDTFGHNTGDELLHSLFNFLAQKMRGSDFLARYGGDELTLVMRGTDLESAQIVTQKVIDLMEEYRFHYPRETDLKLGITAGIAIFPLHASNPGDLLRAADAALYHAKKYHRGSYAIAKGVTGKLNPIHLKDQKS
ncbi:MAG TPA: sensor domain-containing diguanylate cyclase [Anaerolineales bacterium]|nr:sensor domain-containing diguanylate cyclase [Anaerolineales bacterium]